MTISRSNFSIRKLKSLNKALKFKGFIFYGKLNSSYHNTTIFCDASLI
ncbi:hypothetical protein PROVALCAL_01358 [Providencia alcalifaciens DSM 30120]|uniref:Uncharacterized protein n=1 Tax=Providencia alcalifaciens DSM 30120 TaxID=520999 RepID=B6XDD6_9GAMM|nr:hypothetical protein PROVALCAL_01358 [Providencia alcalifaciens DSM 30120]